MTQRHQTRDIERGRGQEFRSCGDTGPSRFLGEIMETSARSGQEVQGYFSEREVPLLGTAVAALKCCIMQGPRGPLKTRE